MRPRRLQRNGGFHPMLAVAASAAVVAAAVTPVALTTMAAPAQASVPAAPAGFTTTFSDDFTGASGTGVSTANWLYDTGTSYAGGAANWGTSEVETNTSSTANVFQDGSGHLVIKPIRSAGGSWTSGRIESQSTAFAAPAGGEMQISASIEQPNPASGRGYWPAFWAMGAAARPVGASNWPSIGELDTMEDVNALSEVSHTFHCGTDPGGPCNETTGLGSGLLACSGCQTGYHTYSVIVDRTNTSAEQLRFYTDSTLQYTVNESTVGAAAWATAVDHGFFIILNVAMGGAYPDAICGCSTEASGALNATTSGVGMSVDYVAVYTKAAGTTTTTAAPTTTVAPTTTAGTTIPATSTIQAEGYNAQSGTTTETTTDTGGGQDVTSLSNGDYLQYNNVAFGTTGLAQFKARIASAAAAGVSGNIEVHLDSLTNPAVSTVSIGNTGGAQVWKTIPFNMTSTTGTHTVYLKFVSGSTANFGSLNWFTFSAT
jgi:Carbohydrate binding module (family 6)